MATSTGIHDHAAPPPIGWGHGCTACDQWALREQEAAKYDRLEGVRPPVADGLGGWVASSERGEEEELEAPPLPEDLAAAGHELVEALDDFARAINRAGARDSDNPAIRRFAAYHLADLEGNDGGAGWLASGLLADALRAFLNGGG